MKLLRRTDATKKESLGPKDAVNNNTTMGASPSSCMEEADSLVTKTGLFAESEQPPSPPPEKKNRSSPFRRQRKHGKSGSSKSIGERGAPNEPTKDNSRADVAAQEASRHSLLRRMGQASGNVVQKSCRTVGNCFKGLEEYMFPRSPLHAELAAKSNKQPVYGAGRTTVRGGVMLDGCETVAEHYEKIQRTMDSIAHLHGAEGLAAVGLEYRSVLCPAHRPTLPVSKSIGGGLDNLDQYGEEYDEELRDGISLGPLSSEPGTMPTDTELTTSQRSLESVWGTSSNKSLDASLFDNMHLNVPQPTPINGVDDDEQATPPHCHLCHRRLYHADTDTPITLDNRKKFIADGDMYEAIAELCQEYAHDVMCQEAGLEWVTVEEDAEESSRASPSPHRRCHGKTVRALVNSNHPLIQTQSEGKFASASNAATGDQPTVLIATGRGKVRAGIFSRQHLICTSLESSTAVPVVCEAKARNMNVVIPDPNARGERFGYETFRKTMANLFSAWEGTPAPTETAVSVPLQGRDLYVLSHSASGAQVARYLMDKSDAYLPHIRAIAFTDSTHNIQWAKSSPDHDGVYNLLESQKCVYFRCSNEQRDGDWYRHTTGEEIKTDEFWRHRFGNIKTYWAGTNEHSLTNWYAHAKIWEHFDRQLHQEASTHTI